MIAPNTTFQGVSRPLGSPKASGRKLPEGTIMSNKLPELCSICSHVSVCANRGSVNDRLFPCEDFLEDRRFSTALPKGAPKLQRNAAQASSGPFRGLCCDCENREGCCLAQASEGGVWHCEEYR